MMLTATPVVVNVKDETRRSVSVRTCFLAPPSVVKYADDMLFLTSRLCLSNLILLETFGFETVLDCPLTHRYLCACCWGGGGGGLGAGKRGTKQTCKC